MEGITWTSIPRCAIILGVAPFIPKSIAATVNLFSPTASITYVEFVETSSARKAPLICGDFRTLTTISSLVSAEFEKIPTRIAPRSRRCRVIARVSTLLIPTIPCSNKSSSSERFARQLLTTGDGFRTTNPLTQICLDSSSGIFMPVLPM